MVYARIYEHQNLCSMFQLQEQIVTLEDCVRDGQTKLKQAQDSLKRESENQSQMSHRLVLCFF